MRRFAIILAQWCIVAVSSGCTVTMHGNQTTGGGATATSTGSSVQAGTRIGSNARIGGSFGTPPAGNAAGGQVAFSKGASAVLVLGLAVAGTVELVSDWFGPSAPPPPERATGGIAHTCSCYGWQPASTPADPPQ